MLFTFMRVLLPIIVITSPILFIGKLSLKYRFMVQSISISNIFILFTAYVFMQNLRGGIGVIFYHSIVMITIGSISIALIKLNLEKMSRLYKVILYFFYGEILFMVLVGVCFGYLFRFRFWEY